MHRAAATLNKPGAPGQGHSCCAEPALGVSLLAGFAISSRRLPPPIDLCLEHEKLAALPGNPCLPSSVVRPGSCPPRRSTRQTPEVLALVIDLCPLSLSHLHSCLPREGWTVDHCPHFAACGPCLAPVGLDKCFPFPSPASPALLSSRGFRDLLPHLCMGRSQQLLLTPCLKSSSSPQGSPCLGLPGFPPPPFPPCLVLWVLVSLGIGVKEQDDCLLWGLKTLTSF